MEDYGYTNDFGENLRRRRKRAGYSQDDLAMLSGYSTQQISYYETGKRKISKKAADKFSKLLDVDIAWFWESEETLNRKERNKILFHERYKLMRDMYDRAFQLFELYGYEFIDLKTFEKEDFFNRPLSGHDVKELIKQMCITEFGIEKELYIHEKDTIVAVADFFPKTYAVIKRPDNSIFLTPLADFATSVSNIAQCVQCQILDLAHGNRQMSKYDFISKLMLPEK